MLQSDTNRQRTELLICGGAIPDSEAGIEAIREVLDSLWKGEMTEADLYQDKLTKRAALIYDAPCMRRIADRFFADNRVQAVRWIAAEMIPADHVPEPAASEVIYIQMSFPLMPPPHSNMLPTVLSHELMEGVRAFLRATFPPSNPTLKDAFDAILNDVGRDKLFQGPYLRVGARPQIKARIILANRRYLF